MNNCEFCRQSTGMKCALHMPRNYVIYPDMISNDFTTTEPDWEIIKEIDKINYGKVLVPNYK